LAGVLWRIAARLLTGPLAFLIAGVIDFAAFGLAALRARRARGGSERGSA
jgi:hypothetical protein